MKVLLFLMSLSLGLQANAAPVVRLFQDIKLPTQKVLEHQSWAAPAAVSTTYVLDHVAGPSSAAAASISSFAAQPDYARNLTVVASGTTASDLASCVVTVSGLNINSHAISETFSFSSSTFATRTGVKAFASVSSVSFPASCETGGFSVVWSVGIGSAFGLKRCMANNGDIIKDLLDGATATVGTYLAATSTVERNTVTFNTSPNASHNYDDYFVQDNQCF